ncbi:MAG TPA: hypothetical protein VK944_00805 [Candidatus Limnocylindria bacterium]|nr:hypothetical protein [Candidatus Limnocylindria bacterium]
MAGESRHQEHREKGARVNPSHRNPSRWPKWVLFITFLLTVPVPYVMVVVGGLIPTFCIMYLAVLGLVVALPKFTGEGFFMLVILWAHVVILGGLLYLLAAGITRVLSRLFPGRYASAVVGILIVTLLFASTFTIYRLPGHNSALPADIFRILKGFLH